MFVAYTQSAAWSRYIEDELLPKLGSEVVVIDRSKESWKRDHPIEAAAIDFWARGRNYNPIAIVVCGILKVRVFGLYEAFQKRKHGDATEIEETVRKLIACKEQVVRDGA